MEVCGKIYGIENMLNHKIYVGRTIKTVEERTQRHRWCKTSLIGRAIRKYGWENFVVVTLEECDNGENLNEAEKRWIKRLNCKKPNGYNLTDGGEGCLGFHHTEASFLRRLERQFPKEIETARQKYMLKLLRKRKNADFIQISTRNWKNVSSPIGDSRAFSMCQSTRFVTECLAIANFRSNSSSP